MSGHLGLREDAHGAAVLSAQITGLFVAARQAASVLPPRQALPESRAGEQRQLERRLNR